VGNKLVTIARFKDNIEAEMAKQTLEDFGIRSVLTGQNTAAAFAGVYPAVYIELQVAEGRAEESREILQSQKKQE